MAGDLKRKTIGALLWNLVDRGGQQVLQFAVVIVVANILCPDDYALVAMLAIFAAIGNIIVESGFGAALIQKRDATEEEYSSVFWLNMGLSLVLYVLLMVLSPLIAAYFGEPQLVALGAVVFLSLPVGATMLIQTTLLNKEVRFRRLAQIDLTGMAVSSTVAVAMAVAGCGVWTLAWQPVTLAATRSLLMWVTGRWRPQLTFSYPAVRGLFGFASGLLLSSLINTCFVNVWSLVIPRLYPKRELGYLTQANRICDPVVNLLYGSIQSATFPIFSGIQSEHERLVAAYRKSIRLTALLTFPMMTGAAAVAPALFRLLFREVWWPAIPFFQILAAGGCFTVLTAVNNNFIKVSGHSRGILHVEVYKVAFTVAAIALLLHAGALAMVGGLVGVRVAIHLVGMGYTQRYTGYRFWWQLCDTLPYLLLALVMGAAVWLTGWLLPLAPLLLLPLQVVAGVAVYTALCWATGSQMLREAVALVRKR